MCPAKRWQSNCKVDIAVDSCTIIKLLRFQTQIFNRYRYKHIYFAKWWMHYVRLFGFKALFLQCGKWTFAQLRISKINGGIWLGWFLLHTGKMA